MGNEPSGNNHKIGNGKPPQKNGKPPVSNGNYKRPQPQHHASQKQYNHQPKKSQPQKPQPQPQQQQYQYQQYQQHQKQQKIIHQQQQQKQQQQQQVHAPNVNSNGNNKKAAAEQKYKEMTDEFKKMQLKQKEINERKKYNDSISDAMSVGFALSRKMSLKDFEMITLIGKGSFGKVWKVRYLRTGQIYALKQLKKKELVARKQVEHTISERCILANISHPFLVSLRFAFQTDTKLFMVMDFFNGGELFFHLQKEGKFAESRSKFYAAEMLLAIECLHSNNIIYRDLKPENILLDYDGHIRITDFGLSKESISSYSLTHTFCGSPEYLAPEMLQQSGYNKMVDIWSYGTILYEMICGLPPFYDENIQKMYQQILYSQIPFYKFMTNSSIDLISRLLEKNPNKRISIKYIKLHPFFKIINWNKLYKKEIEPPFKPKINSPNDSQTNFKKIKENPVSITPSHHSASMINAKDQFPGFTFDENKDKSKSNLNQ